MCGIAGSIAWPLDVARMQQALQHRGPDDTGHWRAGNVELVHTRLAIIDRTGGVQPMSRGPLTICYNGELYDHLALRQQHALQCDSASDTETLLALYERFGLDALEHCDGMFAFALYDRRTHRLTLARDRTGEKPLYFWRDGRRALVFASELNALSTALPLAIDDAAMRRYLSSGLLAAPDTPYRDVEALPPGHAVELDCERPTAKSRRWHRLRPVDANRGETALREVDAADRVDDALAAAVRRELLSSDVPVGAFLSGGIDSGLVCAHAARAVDRLTTFTVSFDGQFDESPLARQVSERYGTDHHTLRVDYASLPERIEEIVGNYGTPTTDDSIIPTWYVAREARRHVKVVLTGDGADEQFGGYRRYVPYAHFPLFGEGGRNTRLAAKVAARLPVPRERQSRYNYLWRLATLAGQTGLERYLATTTMIDDRLLEDRPTLSILTARYRALAGHRGSDLAKLMRMDQETLLAGGLTNKMDIGAMAHGLEARSPFLARDLLDLAPCIPDRMRVRGTTTKWLLRQLARRHLPTAVVGAPKRGFDVPLQHWVAGVLREPMLDLLDDPNARVRGYCRDGAVDAVLEPTSANPCPPVMRARLVWMLYTAEVCLRRHAAVPTPSASGVRALRHSDPDDLASTPVYG